MHHGYGVTKSHPQCDLCYTLLGVGTCSSLTLNSSVTYKLCTSITTVQLNQDVLQEVILPVHLTNHLPEGEMNPVKLE